MEAAGAVTIETAKPFGPAPGRFSASGGLEESGTFLNSSLIVEPPDHEGSVTVHVTQRFTGGRGAFTLRAAITERATGDPHVVDDDGTWAIIDGTGAYTSLRGGGRLRGTADHARDLIRRTYEGAVRQV
jgi:hypothetical protein